MRLVVFALAGLLVSMPSPSAQEPLVLAGTIALPGVEGRIDHLAFDPVAQRLYVAALGNNTVEVLDLEKRDGFSRAASGRHVKSLPGFREPQGIAALPDARLIAVANGQGDGLQLLNADDFRMGSRVRLGDDSDNVRYDAAGTRVYVGFGGGALAAINATDRTVLAEAKLAGHPESFQLERSGARIFVNVPAADQIAVVDRGSMQVVATWRVAGARANYPMSLDDAGHRLIVGCRRPAKALVFDTTTGREVASFDIVGDTDDLFYDDARKQVYVSGGEGFLDVYRAEASNRFARVGRIATAAGARTSLFVPETSCVYLAVPHRGAQHAEIRVYQVR